MSELFTKLGIDWRLLLAQVVNFGILVFLLTKFLYRPLLKMLDERKVKIAEGLAQAQEAAQARRDAEAWRVAEAAKLHREADKVLLQAKTQAEKMRADILAQGLAEVQRIREQTKRELERDKQRVFNEAQKELAGLAIFAAEKVLERSITDVETKKAVEEAIRYVK